MGEREPSDEELMSRLVSGREDALGQLHGRYAPLIFNIASHSLGRCSAEEIVQDVFLAIWRKANSFDPTKGTFRSWALRIAHNRVINELRRRARRPRVEADSIGPQLGIELERGLGPDELAWIEDRRSIVREAVEGLPAAQRQALSLAFLEDLTHQQVAESLSLPLGTTKSRIRSGLQALRAQLSPSIASGLLLVGLLAISLIHDRMMRSAIERNETALRLVTSSDVVPIRLVSTPGTPVDTHGNYRGRPGMPMAVLTFSNFREAPDGQAYRAWGMFGGRWHELGRVSPDALGNDLIIIEGPHLAAKPSALRVTLEPVEPRTLPGGQTVIAWPGP